MARKRETKRGRGRPKGAVPPGKPIAMRASPELQAKIDRWRAQQPDVPSRAEAVKRLTELGLGGQKGRPERI